MSDHHEQSDCDREMRSSFEEGGSSAAGAQQQPAKRKKRELTAEEKEKNNARHRRDRAKNKDELVRLRKIEVEYNKLQLNAKGTKAETGEQSAVINVMLNQSDDYLKQLKVTKEMAEKGSRMAEDCWNKVANSGPGKEIIQQAMSEDCQITSGTTTNRIGNKEDEIQKVVSEEDVLVLHDCCDQNLERFAASLMKTPSPQSLEDVMNNQENVSNRVSQLAKEIGLQVNVGKLGDTSNIGCPSNGNNSALLPLVAGKGKGPIVVEGSDDADNESLKMASEQGGNGVISAADFGYGDLRGVKMTDDFEGYRIPVKLHPTATSLLRRIPTIFPRTPEGSRFYNLRTDTVILLCAAVFEIETTPYAKMGNDEIRRWRGAIHEAKCVGFNVDLIGSGLEHIVERLNTSTPGPFMYWKDI